MRRARAAMRWVRRALRHGQAVPHSQNAWIDHKFPAGIITAMFGADV